jgi:pimeloyl-ACP methyl ester carboxylesterase
VSTVASRRAGDGEPMLLVHGITDTYRTWELTQPLLAERHDTLAITLLGHSGGAPLGDDGTTSLRELVDEAERDMDAAGFETAHLVGNSLGGWIVLELAARGRARSVVTLSPAGGWDPGNAWALASYWQLVAQQRALALTKPLALSLAARPRGRWVVLGGLVSDPPAVPASLATALVRGAADCPAALPLLLESRANGYPDLGEIDCPVRIAWGTKDRLLPFQHVSARFRTLVPQADWVDIPGAGHLPQIDHPELTAELVLEVSDPRRPA